MSMNRAEYLGAQLIMLIRREGEQLAALAETQAKIDAVYNEVKTMESGQLYASTGELPKVVSAPVKPSEAVTQVQPFRADHLDGGSTFALTPVLDAITGQQRKVT